MGAGNQKKELGRNILFQHLAAAGGSPIPCDYGMVGVVVVGVVMVAQNMTSTTTTAMKSNLLRISRVRQGAARILRRNG